MITEPEFKSKAIWCSSPIYILASWSCSWVFLSRKIPSVIPEFPYLYFFHLAIIHIKILYFCIRLLVISNMNMLTHLSEWYKVIKVELSQSLMFFQSSDSFYSFVLGHAHCHIDDTHEQPHLPPTQFIYLLWRSLH